MAWEDWRGRDYPDFFGRSTAGPVCRCGWRQDPGQTLDLGLSVAAGLISGRGVNTSGRLMVSRLPLHQYTCWQVTPHILMMSYTVREITIEQKA